MSVADVIQAAWPRLSPAERRVAEAVRRDPEAVAFGTVARVGERAGTSGPSVLRLAGKLGYTGFVGLQAAVRSDLSERLRPAVERIRSPLRAPLLERALDVESENLRRTLAGLDPRRFDAAVRRLGDPKRRVTILPSEQCAGVASLFAGELALLEGVGRSADLRAGPQGCTLLALTEEALNTLAEDDPAMGMLMMRNLAISLGKRLRLQNWRAARALDAEAAQAQ